MPTWEMSKEQLNNAAISKVLTNVMGDPIDQGKDGINIKTARELVKTYNGLAFGLASIVKQLVDLRVTLKDDVATGAVIISGSGWQDNALAEIPMLKMYDEDFPAKMQAVPSRIVVNSGKFFQECYTEATGVCSFSSGREIDPVELARKASDLQKSEALKGRHISITEAVGMITQQPQQ